LWDMKNITVSVDEETYRRARIKAAENDTSVSAVVKRLLTEFADGESTFERLAAKEAALRASIRSFDASDRLSRDELHERGT
jgi:hypothetical protein